MKAKHLFGIGAAILTGILAFPGLAADVALEGLSKNWQMGMVESASPVMDKLTGLHNYFLIIITAISLFVLALLIYVCVRFNAKANPTPSKTSHNTMLEIAWTLVPVLILVAMAIPSLRIHYYMDRTEVADMTVKVTGRQWYWEYYYPDAENLSFESRMKEDQDLLPDEPRLLSVNNKLVVPVNKTVRLQTTGGDVIHAWAVPAFGFKIDAVPGRLNESWFKATRTGTFYGQCSELCGVGHGFMPIVVEVVTEEEFNAWLVEAKQKFAQGESVHPTLASAE